jgi:hypothetical protein
MMAPPKVGAPSQTTYKTRSSLRSPQETAEVAQEMAQREGIVDVDAIPSPQIEPVTTTLVEEEEKSLTMSLDGD